MFFFRGVIKGFENLKYRYIRQPQKRRHIRFCQKMARKKNILSFETFFIHKWR